MAEAASNPEWNITIGGRNQAAFHVPGGNGDEIGDGEAQNYTYRVNGALVQSYLSQRDHTYLVTNGSTNNFLVSSARVLTFQESGGGSNRIGIFRVGNGVAAELNSSTAQFEPGSIRGITVNALSGDSISIGQTGADAPVTVNLGSGSNSVNVGSARNLDNIQGNLTLTGGSGVHRLNIDDSGRFFPFPPEVGVYTLTPTTVQRNGTALITYAGMTAVALSTGSGALPVNIGITGTAAGTDTGLTVAPSGVNFISVGNGNRTLDALQGPLTVTGSSGANVLGIDDSGFTGADRYTITDRTVTAARLPGSVSYTGITALSFSTGPGSDTFDIESTSASTTVTAGTGGNLFHLSPFSQYLASIAAPLTLNGGGSDTLVFFDVNNPNNERYTFDDIPSRLTLATLPGFDAHWTGMGAVTLWTNGASSVDDPSGRVQVDPGGGPHGGAPSSRQENLGGGTTVYDTDDASLQAFLQFWESVALENYNDAVNNLLAGNAVPALNTDMVHSNGTGNQFTGGLLNLCFGSSTLDSFETDPPNGTVIEI
jgi:hypothetical protein